jgi:hypothetical protein
MRPIKDNRPHFLIKHQLAAFIFRAATAIELSSTFLLRNIITTLPSTPKPDIQPLLQLRSRLKFSLSPCSEQPTPSLPPFTTQSRSMCQQSPN